MYACFLQDNHTLNHTLQQGRMGWLQLIKGSITVNGEQMEAGDGAAIREDILMISCLGQAEFYFLIWWLDFRLLHINYKDINDE
ncbi:pirin family protein [Legionella septentrionalis]|uniref:pirin family protein n=1 Tax=Legionella septentrionalis TaxID=2498109 RepID=UPI002D7715F6|nr:hypothetical protein [Legionella septentrionalis]